MKLISWNVNGIRAIAQKNLFEDLEKLDADMICFQETKANTEQVAEALKPVQGYHLYASAAERPGYSGTAVLSKIQALSFTEGIGMDEHDKEGRVITLEYDSFFLVNVYVPNAGNDLKRLDYRQEWDLAFYHYLKNLEKKKPVLVCGDFNVAHTDIDLARPKANYNKSAGYTQAEIDGMDRFVNGGLLDTFRQFHPGEKDRYSWWSYRMNARGKNIGWRIDYFLVSESFVASLKNADILDQYMGSDHCPVLVELEA